MTGRDDRGRYLLLVAGTVVAGLAGYAGYVLYPRFGLPPVAGASVLVLASAAGFAAFFSPCSFPLLAALLAREASAEQGSWSPRPGRALLFAMSLSVGAVVFVTVVGLLFAVGAAA